MLVMSELVVEVVEVVEVGVLELGRSVNDTMVGLASRRLFVALLALRMALFFTSSTAMCVEASGKGRVPL